jgi:hypothetical protein
LVFHTSGVLGWLSTSIMVAGSLILLGLLAATLTDPRHVEFSLLIALLGLSISIALNLADRKFDEIARQKYQRCKDLELRLGGKQHLEVRSRYPSLRYLVNMITLALAVTWVLVLLLVVFEFGRAQ